MWTHEVFTNTVTVCVAWHISVEVAYLMRYSTEMWISKGRCEVLLKSASPWLRMWRVSALRALVRINTAREVDNGYLQTNQSTEALSSVLKLYVLLKTSDVHRGKTDATSKLEIIFDSSEFSGMRLNKCASVSRRIPQQILSALEFLYALHRQRKCGEHYFSPCVMTARRAVAPALARNAPCVACTDTSSLQLQVDSAWERMECWTQPSFAY